MMKMWQDDFVRILNDEFVLLKEHKSGYTLRAFARKLGLSPGSLSDTMKKRRKWQIRPRRAAEILEKLSLKGSVKNRLLLEMGESPHMPKRDLKASDYDVLTNWIYLPVLCSFDLPAKLCTIGQIAARLVVSEKKVIEVVEDLLKRRLLVKNEMGHIRRPHEILEANQAPPSEILKQHHLMNLDLSKKALLSVPPEQRDFTSLTFAGNPKQIEFLRKEIRTLYETACVLLDGEEENENVFHLSIHLFPMEFEKI